ncbi:GQ67_00283T0 [Komagataella phaffii]|nr:GQ67_00283T0 [Komagataella phaffii]AOA67333.1 GQ68_01106T0 [Komagataella phaffii GS115]
MSRNTIREHYCVEKQQLYMCNFFNITCLFSLSRVHGEGTSQTTANKLLLTAVRVVPCKTSLFTRSQPHSSRDLRFVSRELKSRSASIHALSRRGFPFSFQLYCCNIPYVGFTCTDLYQTATTGLRALPHEMASFFFHIAAPTPSLVYLYRLLFPVCSLPPF